MPIALLGSVSLCLEDREGFHDDATRLMLTLLGGWERDEEQWRVLLRGSGFESVRIEDGLIDARCR